MQLKHIKPYLFILGFLLVPLLFVPAIKWVKNNYSEIEQETDNVIITPTPIEKGYGLVIHGGAGNFTNADISDDAQIKYHLKLEEALRIGMQKIENGDSAIYVVVDVIKILEDSPLFNAGKGAVYTNEGKNELDASIMNGIDKNAGAVAGVTNIKNPIEAALEVMLNSKHVLLASTGAEQFAKKQNLEIVNPSYFRTERQWNNLQKATNKNKMGTVGCAVLDKNGNLAAGTSTGGMTNKKFGRIGDSPIIGAGTYADNKTCAVSATGHGEYFIRYNVSYDIAARMKYLNQPFKPASQTVIQELKTNGGIGGIVGIDSNGNVSMAFNTTGMFRGFYTNKSEPQTYLFKD